MKLTLPSWNDARFNVEADMDLLARLTSEMELRGGDLQPAAGWRMLPEKDVYGSINNLLYHWCGIGAIRLAELRLDRMDNDVDLYVALCERYLRRIDYFGLLNGVTLEDLASAQWRILDLDSLIDFLHMSVFFDFNQARPAILEIGGGFGRVIEFIALLTGKRFRYVNIDAVPVSLMYCYQYLKARFPSASVKMLHRDADVREIDCDFLIVPSWNLGSLELEPVDLGINIESMQEMHQKSVDFYIEYLDLHVAEGGIIFLENSREHEFIGNWTFPDNWQCLFRNRTARSWTNDHPTEVFRKTLTSHLPENILRRAIFFQEVCYARSVQELTPEDQFHSGIGMAKSVATKLL
jgi:SAM-dependent methyltransferase